MQQFPHSMKHSLFKIISVHTTYISLYIYMCMYNKCVYVQKISAEKQSTLIVGMRFG